MEFTQLTKNNFKNEIYQENVSYLVEFWSPYSEICRLINPVLEKLVEENAGQFFFGEINADEEDALAYLFDIQELPTLILFKNCEIVKRLEGAVPKNEILDLLKLLQ
jgi:thioredoxin 1